MSDTDYDLVLYTKCAHCHLFVDGNAAYGDSPGLAEWSHLHRGDDADNAIDESHEPEPSEMSATLDTWKAYGPPEMRARFADEPDVRGCSCGMADYGAPGHDGHKEN